MHERSGGSRSHMDRMRRALFVCGIAALSTLGWDASRASAQDAGLLPLSQHAMRFTNNIGYHDYEGLALELDEQARLTRDLGEHKVMILRNHGLLACGESVAEAFDLMYYLERACQSQVNAMAGGAKLRVPPAAVAEKVASQFKKLAYTAKKTECDAL